MRKTIAVILSIIVIFQCSVVFAVNDNEFDVDYTIEGNVVIETLTIDEITITREIFPDGSATIVITEGNISQTVTQTESFDYELFYSLATQTNMQEISPIPHDDDIQTRGSEITGSQFQHYPYTPITQTFTRTQIDNIRDAGISYVLGLLATSGIPGAGLFAFASIIVALVGANSPSKMIVTTTVNEVRTVYDNQYYCHCHHLVIESYDSENHYIGTTRDYYQTIGV